MADQTQTRTAPGVIDTLSAGFEAVNKIIWVMSVPILLDLVLWIGPRLSIGELVHRWLDRYLAMMNWYAAQSGTLGSDQQMLEQSRQVVEMTRTFADQFNLLWLLTVAAPLVPSIVAALNQGGPGGVVEVPDALALVGLSVLLLGLGLLLTCVYLGLLAQQIRDGRIDLHRLGRSLWRYWLSLLGFWGILLGVTLAVGTPVALVAGLLQMLAPAAGAGLMALLMVLFVMAVFVAQIYLFFIQQAVVVSEIGPLKAMLNSARVVSNNFWPTLGLIGLTMLILLGMGQVWRNIAGQSWGVAVAVIANAYIASGLVAASMFFYRARLNRLPTPRRLSGLGQ